MHYIARISKEIARLYNAKQAPHCIKNKLTEWTSGFNAGAPDNF